MIKLYQHRANAITEDAKKPIKKPFVRSDHVESSYAERLVYVANSIDDILGNYDPNNQNSVNDLLNMLKDYSNQLFDWASKTATKVIYSLNDDDKKKWQAHSNMMTKALRDEINKAPIDQLMQRYLAENVSLIQSMPLQAAINVQKLVLENLISGGQRAASLSDDIMKIGNVTKNRAMLIARTEVSRISTGLTKARSEELEIDWYVWRTSHDVRVRHAHSIMDNVLVKWSDPASPEKLVKAKKDYGHYHPGEIFNCRCFAQPLIRLDDVRFPCKVYIDGQIKSMARSTFEKLNGIELEKAA